MFNPLWCNGIIWINKFLEQIKFIVYLLTIPDTDGHPTGRRRLLKSLPGWKVTRWAPSAEHHVSYRCWTLPLWRGLRRRWRKPRWFWQTRPQAAASLLRLQYQKFSLCVLAVLLLTHLSLYSLFLCHSLPSLRWRRAPRKSVWQSSLTSSSGWV